MRFNVVYTDELVEEDKTSEERRGGKCFCTILAYIMKKVKVHLFTILPLLHLSCPVLSMCYSRVYYLARHLRLFNIVLLVFLCQFSSSIMFAG